ncbi:secretin N-terminal domain-containing protein [Undibacterium sp. Ji50W]|uniref:secretin N-terminal domain-containing protein n=1 Tax=Undibacterium sp. Ji50W TaxID=3413041 RepID=UPI003BEFC375
MKRMARNVLLIGGLLGLAACAITPVQTKPTEIRALLDAGRLEEGIAQLEDLLKQTPGHVEARVLLVNARRQLAMQFLNKAAQDTRREAWDEAQAAYRQAAVLGEVEQAMLGVRTLAASQYQSRLLKNVNELWDAGKQDEARKELHAFLTEFPRHAKGLQLQRKIGEPEARMQNAVLSAAFQKRLSLQFRDAPVRAVLEAMSHSSGINFTLDRDVPSDVRVNLDLRDTTVELALRNLLMSVQLEQRVVDERTVLIYPSDQAKQRSYQQLSIRSFKIANAEAKLVANSLRTLLKTRDLVVDEKLNMLVIRDTPETIRMAAKLVALHDVAEPEVMLEVEILEVQRSDLEALGVKWPGNIGLSPLAKSGVGDDGSINSGAFTLHDLMHINSRSVLATVDAMKLSATVNRENVSVLANPRIRIKSREKAQIKVGERVPSVSSNVTATGVTSQSVNYLDVGLKLEAEPVVYLDDEISIKLNLEVSSILGTIYDSNNQPYGYRIGARNATTVLRLRDGENQVLAGLISDNDKRSVNAVPGLGELPVLDRLFGNRGAERTKTEIVLSITPRVIRNQPLGASGDIEFDAGTDASLRGRDGVPGQQPVLQQQSVPLQSTQPTQPPMLYPPAGEKVGG